MIIHFNLFSFHSPFAPKLPLDFIGSREPFDVHHTLSKKRIALDPPCSFSLLKLSPIAVSVNDGKVPHHCVSRFCTRLLFPAN